MAQNTIRQSNHPINMQTQVANAAKPGFFGRVKKALGEAFSSDTTPAKQQNVGQDRYVSGTPIRVAAERHLGRVTAGRPTMTAKTPSVFSDDQLVAYLNHIRQTGDPATTNAVAAPAAAAKRIS